MLPEQFDNRIRFVAHLPVVRAALDQLGILEVIEECCPRHPLNRVSDAECVATLVLKVLSGGPALWRVDVWAEKLDLDVLIGEGVEADAFNDTRLAQALDHLDAAGTDNVMLGVARQYLDESPREDCYSVRHDTTSVKLFGRYDDDFEPKPARGFSKDHRPDLKQLIYGLTLHGSTGVPLVVSVDDGNTADSTVARDHLGELAKLLPDEHEVTFVGDCKLVDQYTLGKLMRQGLHFISLVPNTFGVRGQLIEQAWTERPDLAEWPVLGSKPGRRKGDPDTYYRGFSYEAPMCVRIDPDGKSWDEEMRFVVVYSDRLAAKFDATLDKKLDKERAKLDKQLARLNRKGFACEPDALAAVEPLVAKLRFHAHTVAATEETVVLKRARPGRPRKGEKPPEKKVWRVAVVLEKDDTRIEQLRRKKGSFVLVTDWLSDPADPSWTDQRVLREYRQQSMVEGHTGFRWLKGPAAVAPVFIKTPSRIRAMALVLILALMVRNHIQTTLNAQLAAEKTTLRHPFSKQQVHKLTPEMAFQHLAGAVTQELTLGSELHRLPVKVSEHAEQLLSLLGLDKTVFQPRTRHSRKWRRLTFPTPEL